jgi:hypothetical protein
MKAIYIYALLFLAVIPAGRAQNIFSGGISDGFSSDNMGFDIYAGGISNGFAMDSSLIAVPLPVTLLNFTAQAMGSQVQLRWQTASEFNNDHFEVERSRDANNFNWLLSVAGHGDSQLLQDYQAVDAAPVSGINYYRLKQVDKDGQFLFSRVVSVDMISAPAGSSTRLYPNPAADVIYFNITSPQNIHSSLVVFNAAGRQVVLKPSYLVKGGNSLSLDVSTLAPGIYFCLFENTDTGVQSFIKQ